MLCHCWYEKSRTWANAAEEISLNLCISLHFQTDRLQTFVISININKPTAIFKSNLLVEQQMLLQPGHGTLSRWCYSAIGLQTGGH